MKRFWIGCLSVMCFACSKAEHDKSAATAPAARVEQAAPTEAVPNADQPTDGEAKAIAALKADPAAKLKAYVAYQQRWLDLLKRFGERSQEYKEKEKAGQFEGVTGMARTAIMLNSLGTEAKTAMDKMKAESGLSEEELSALAELTTHAQAQGELQKRVDEMNSAQGAEQVAKLEQLMQSAPAEAREEMKKQLEEIKQSQIQLRDLASMKEQREKYGNAVVEATLAMVPQLNAQLKEYSASTK